MVELVNALLNISRIELGTFMIEPEQTDIVKITESILDEVKQKIKSKNLKIVRGYSAKMPISADTKLLRIIIQNIITNAVKYTPSGGTISIKLQKQSSNYQITIADTGYGIPQKQQNKIFSKLFRADNIREMETDGTGLGLYIVKRIVDQAGGKIWFKSQENKGTTFFITLPKGGMEKKEGSRGLISEGLLR